MTELSDPTGVLESIDQSLYDWRGGVDAMRWTPEPAPAPPPLIDLTGVFSRLAEVMPSVMRAVQKFGAVLGKTARDMHVSMGRKGLLEGVRGHKVARCRLCSPRANPRPLCIDGAAYHRRRQAR